MMMKYWILQIAAVAPEIMTAERGHRIKRRYLRKPGLSHSFQGRHNQLLAPFANLGHQVASATLDLRPLVKPSLAFRSRHPGVQQEDYSSRNLV